MVDLVMWFIRFQHFITPTGSINAVTTTCQRHHGPAVLKTLLWWQLVWDRNRLTIFTSISCIHKNDTWKLNSAQSTAPEKTCTKFTISPLIQVYINITLMTRQADMLARLILYHTTSFFFCTRDRKQTKTAVV